MDPVNMPASPQKTTHKCTKTGCNKELSTEKHLKRHISEVHGGTVFLCSHCNHGYTREYRRTAHLKGFSACAVKERKIQEEYNSMVEEIEKTTSLDFSSEINSQEGN
jgi:uncharacterized Zn-finger protein